MVVRPEYTPKLPGRKALRKGAAWFALLCLFGLTVVALRTVSPATVSMLRNLEWGYLFASLALVGVDLLVGTLRLYSIIFPFQGSGWFWTCFHANLANIFLAAITPSQTGGGIAQIYVFHKRGLPLALALTVSIATFVPTLTLLLIAAIVSLNLLTTATPNTWVSGLFRFSSLAFLAAFLLFTAFVFRPRTFAYWINRLLLRIGRTWPRTACIMEGAAIKLESLVNEYTLCMAALAKRPRTIFLVVFLTLALYGNKCLVALTVLKALGLAPPASDVLRVFALVIFFLYFAPTPGASFVGETGTALAVSTLAPSHVLAPAAFMWRFFTTYLSVPFGAWVLFRTLTTDRAASENHPMVKASRLKQS